MTFSRVLVANNGMAATKFLTSMSLVSRAGTSEALPLFYGMVSPDDLESNATYIQMLDFVIQVPGGPSAMNYGNVELIVRLALEHGCDAVWPGWGHASENHLLAVALEQANIVWIGPGSASMLMLGDKVESLLQAQNVGVPCTPWSGTSATTASDCSLHSPEDAMNACDLIGYPVMLKASSGGGGKGIRRVNSRDECGSAFLQIRSEIRDGIVFAMKCVDDCRHVEIQVIGDGQGDCVALSGRDCSVQRRHQKLIEEGPPPNISPETMRAMERAAESLCGSVKYKNAGTVEFLYHPGTSAFYFLEVNCRLQVEHPVTELLWDLNLPYIQLLIAANASRSLRDLPGIGAFLENRSRDGGRHVVACRLVAEDPSSGWLPSSGEIFEIRPPVAADRVFAYFSVSSCGSGIHQFADSQFGHVFAVGDSRESAIRRLHDYLSNLTIVGSVSTNVSFMLSTVLYRGSPFAVEGPPSTAWLDRQIGKNSHACTDPDQTPLALLAACSHLATTAFACAEKEILRWVRKGHRAPHVPTSYSECLTCVGGEKVGFEISRIGRNRVRISSPAVSGGSVDVEWVTGNASKPARGLMRVCSEKGSVMVNVVAVGPCKLRVQLARSDCWHTFTIEDDSSKVLAPMNGRLTRWLVADGAVVEAGERLCEIEAMKMVTVVRAKSAGVVRQKVLEKMSFIEGDVLAGFDDSSAADTVSKSPACTESPVLAGLAKILQSADTTREESGIDQVMAGLDGFAPGVPDVSELSPAEIGRALSQFVRDESVCLNLIPSTNSVDLDFIASIQSLVGAPDDQLIAAWRHRMTLPGRALIAIALVRATHNVHELVNAVNTLNARLHGDLLSTIYARILTIDPTHAIALESVARGISEDEVTANGHTWPANNHTAGEDEIAVEKLRAMAAEAGSFYIHDLPAMLEHAVGDLWNRGSGTPPVHPLVVADRMHWPDEPELNTCGMVAWVVTMVTPEFPAGRRAVFVGNDITYQIGTFSVAEDKVYLRASELARTAGIPRIYIACNSGARLGLCTEVQKRFRVEWVDDTDISKGFQFLYLTEEDYQAVNTLALSAGDGAGSPVVAIKTAHAVLGHVYVLTDILGFRGENLGVENLVWSGAIAGESSRAYDETFTLSYVTGRTVGIGAYIARLCQRIIQKTDSPILLTGYQALNKLIGTDVYHSNDEIGGVGVMFRNGVSHLTVETDTEGISKILEWLQFIPAIRGGSLPVLQAVTDPTTRELEEESSVKALFDKESLVEVQAAWAKSVIVGRARIGGIPLGVIIVETRQTHYFQPADPADPLSQSIARPQAGQVWYPDSAYKTAQAIMDFNREGLPMIILANWRGFSGGQRDMFNEILKYGSYIVDALRVYKQPVFIYLPPRAELRGGAWVVVDSRINPEQIEMYADPTARGGVLEPSGTTEIKFRARAMYDLMLRTDPGAFGKAGKHLNQHFESIKPILSQVANEFADMHDTPTRMIHTGAIREIVPWRNARSFFYDRLKDRLSL